MFFGSGCFQAPLGVPFVSDILTASEPGGGRPRGATERRRAEGDGRLEDQEGDYRAASLDRASSPYGFGLDGDAGRGGDGAGDHVSNIRRGRLAPRVRIRRRSVRATFFWDA